MAASPELPPGLRPAGRERWKKWVAIGFLVLLGLALLGYFAPRLQRVEIRLLPREYEEFMRAKSGFYPAYMAGNVLVFVFYQHPQYGLYPLEDGDLLPSNELIIYLFSFAPAEANITAEEYVLVERVVGNQTVRAKLDLRTYTLSAYLPGRQFVETRLRVREAREERTLDVYVNGFHILRLRHKTFPAFITMPQYTLGSLEADRAGFIGLTTIVVLLALGLAKSTIRRVKWVPDLPRWLVASGLLIALVAVAAAWYLIAYFALVRALHLLVPVGIFSYFYGLVLMRQRPIDFYLTHMEVGGGQPRKFITIVPVTRQVEEGMWEVAPERWRDFFKAVLLGRKRFLRLLTPDGFTPRWFIDLGAGDREYVVEGLEHNGRELTATIAPLHKLDVEKWTYQALGVQDLARAKEILRRSLMRLRARMWAIVDQQTHENVRHMVELRRRLFLGPRGPQPPVLPYGQYARELRLDTLVPEFVLPAEEELREGIAETEQHEVPQAEAREVEEHE